LDKTSRQSPQDAPTLWKPQRSYLRRTIPAGLSDWLLDPASLTHRLQQLCPRQFRVQVLEQQWRYPQHDEARVLGMAPRGTALVRQVRLLCGDQPWVYARTVIPAASLQGDRRRLRGLGSRPLGAVLFADPTMKRGVVELARLLPGERLFRDATRGLGTSPAEIWGRRSVFTLSGRPLLVSEIFLPAVPAVRRHWPFWKRR
jgi:chorismate--pyruvate lyase